jgi:hypothetical protein
MKHPQNGLRQIGAVTLMAAALVVASAGCKSSGTGSRTASQEKADNQLAGEVKKQLSQDSMYRYQDVQSMVYEGTVQLTGFVDTDAERQRAAEIASRTIGVRQVVNSIALKPVPTGRNTNAPSYKGPAYTTNAPPWSAPPSSGKSSIKHS